MATYYKPQSPIQSGEDFIYPITTADQVKVDKDTRLNAVGVYLKNIDNSTDTTVYGNNATTLGGVAAEDYALKTDTAPDSAKLGGKAPEYYLNPKNLLDNSDFTNPVNQRGATSYTGAGYCLDRWRTWIDTDTVSLNDGYVSTTGNGLHQYIKLGTLKNTVHTLAVLKSDGALLVYAQNPHDKIYFDSSIGIGFGYDVEDICTVKLGEGSYVWAALYEGSYTADTLPPYVPKGYAAELAECQRYFRKGVQAVTMGTQYNNSGSIFSLSVPRMRINPTTTLTDILSQGWGNVAASNYTAGWIDNFGSSFYVNYISSVSDDVGKNVAVVYEISADL